MLISDYLVPEKKKKKKNIIIIGLIITGILSATLVIVTYFGFFTGTNYLLLDRALGARGIHISINKDLSERTSRITIEPVSEFGIDEIYHGDIDFNVRNSHGFDVLFGEFVQNKNGVIHRYAVYQFYLINDSDQSADTQYVLNISQEIEIVKATKNIDDALGYRVFIDEFVNQTPVKEVYDSGVILGEDKYNSLPLIENVRPKEVRRITVFFWLEGDLTKDTMIGGSFRIRIKLSIGSLEDET